MKHFICYGRTLRDWRIVLSALLNFGAIYIAHDYVEQPSYIEDDKLYEPLKCETCGAISVAWRKFN